VAETHPYDVVVSYLYRTRIHATTMDEAAAKAMAAGPHGVIKEALAPQVLDVIPVKDDE
jgi:hypothetical protein